LPPAAFFSVGCNLVRSREYQSQAARSVLHDTGNFFHAEVKEAGMLHPQFSRNALTSTVATLLVALAPVAAHANDALLVRKSVVVPVADLDLSKPAGAAALNVRIRRAAEQACGVGISPAAPTYSPPDRDCINDAVTRAVESLRRRPGA
jgi:UrcA family protein